MGGKILLVRRGRGGGILMVVGDDRRCTSTKASSHKRPHAVEEIGPWVVDGHARVVRILSPTLGGLRPQIMPHLLSSVEIDRRRWGESVFSRIHRFKLGPLIGRLPVAKCSARDRNRSLQVFSLLGLSRQVGREGLDSRRKGREIALAHDEHPAIGHLDDVSVDVYQYAVNEKNEDRNNSPSRQNLE